MKNYHLFFKLLPLPSVLKKKIYIYILYHKKIYIYIKIFQVGEHIIFPFSTLGSEPCPSKNGLIQKKHPKALLITKKRWKCTLFGTWYFLLSRMLCRSRTNQLLCGKFITAFTTSYHEDESFWQSLSTKGASLAQSMSHSVSRSVISQHLGQTR